MADKKNKNKKQDAYKEKEKKTVNSMMMSRYIRIFYHLI